MLIGQLYSFICELLNFFVFLLGCRYSFSVVIVKLNQRDSFLFVFVLQIFSPSFSFAFRLGLLVCSLI